MYLKNLTIFKNSVPVALSYIVLGFTWGVLFAKSGGSILEAFLISTFCFAGAAQFIAIQFYNSSTNSYFLLITIFLINIRHLFYGLTYLGAWKNYRSKIYLLSALTDENFGLAGLYPKDKLTEGDYIKIFVLNHVYWIIGCTTGAMLLANAKIELRGFEFALTALFVAIFSNSMRKSKI